MQLQTHYLRCGIFGLILLATLGGIWGGPALGDHEAIVAECARNMRITGDWVVPQFLDTPFMRKPPLPYWLVAMASYVFPLDPATSLPVTSTAARLPSALAGLITILLLWRLGSAMFGIRTGMITAVIAGSSLFILQYSPNATAEMPLTCCCTWAYLHFWYSVRGSSHSRQRLHIILFYVALGFGMLAKGPAPLIMTAVPLAAWWYFERPLRILVRGGGFHWKRAVASGLRGLWPQTKAAFTRLWLLPGLILFAAIFVPWMVAVAAKHAHAWDLWNWQYIQRAEGDYEDTRPRGLFYYIPYAFGLTTPWLFLLPEALAAPWLRRYAQYRRPLLYAGFWCVVSIAFMSIEPFKKPYYILPAIPALILLMAVVAERLYGMRFQIRSPQLVWALFFIAATATAIGIGIALHQLRQTMPALLIRITPIVVVTAHLLFLAIAAFIRGKGWSAFGLTAGTSIVAFTATWQLCGPVFGNLDKVTALARALDKAGVPADTQILWADKRPDARLSFYFGRQSRYMVTPAEIVSRMVDRTKAKMQLLELAVERAKDLLENSRPVYLIVERSNYDKMMRVRRFTELAHLIDIVHEAGDPERKDWTIISNIKPSLASFNTSKTSP